MAEFRRVLTPGGHIVLACFESESEPVTWVEGHLPGIRR